MIYKCEKCGQSTEFHQAPKQYALCRFCAYPIKLEAKAEPAPKAEAPAPAPAPKVKKSHDLNKDGKVDAKDEVIMHQEYNKHDKASKEADLNNDGKVDLKDVEEFKK